MQFRVSKAYTPNRATTPSPHTTKGRFRGLFAFHMDIDFNTATWAQVVRWAQARIDAARLRNDGDLDSHVTASLRGELKAYKNLIGLPEAAARARSTESADSPFGGTASF